MEPRVAVVIPCHEDGVLALEAARSVQEAEPVEVVVVDDGSRQPETLEALGSLGELGARLVRHGRNRGLSEARMTGVRETSAPYVFDLDADDLAVPGALALMADRLTAHPATGVCFGDYAELAEPDRLRTVPHRIEAYRLAYANEYPTSALFRRAALVELGGWELRSGYEDWDLWLKFAGHGDPGVHAGDGVVTYRRRLHGARMLAATRRRHRATYRELRDRHPDVFGAIAQHRRASTLSPGRKVLYPVVFGGRPRFAFEHRVRAWMDRLGVWRVQR